MVGRASLIVILGFSMIIGVANMYWTQSGGKAVTNVTQYYYSTVAHNGAVAAANLICDSIFQNPQDTIYIINGSSLQGSFPDGGTYKIVGQMQPSIGKYRNCLITASCSDPVPSAMDYVDTVQILLGPYSFSRYAFYTNNDSGPNWVTGDTLTGPYMSNGSMNVTGTPVMKGPVSIGRKVYNSKSVGYPGVTWANWEKNHDTLKASSFRSGVTDSLPTAFDSTYTINSATKVFSNSNPSYQGSKYNYDVYLTFNSDGTVTETDTTRYNYSGIDTVVAESKDTTISLSAIADPKTGENVIRIDDGDAHVSGTVHGNVTVLAMQPSSNNRKSSSSQSASPSYYNSNVDGNILISNSIKYVDSTTDMLGLVATNSVMLTTQTSSVTIDGAIFALKGSFTYQNYSSGGHVGYINVFGSLIQYKRGAIGLVGGTGYYKDYRYDSRFRNVSPPGFPLSRRFVIYSWLE